MSFPIYRADLQDATSPKLDLSSVELPESSTFVEKRVLTLSKQITQAAARGDKNITLTIVISKNVEPVSAGLIVNFPDTTFTVGSNTNGVEQNPSGAGPRGSSTPIVVSWD